MEGERSAGGLSGLGYQGYPQADVVDELLARGTAVVADVRLNPTARVAGLSKTSLARALVGVGIAYRHLPEFGNPRANRAGFADTTGPPAARCEPATGSCSPARRPVPRWTGSPTGRWTRVVVVLCLEPTRPPVGVDVLESLERAQVRRGQPEGLAGVGTARRLVDGEDRAERAEGVLRHLLDRQAQPPADDRRDVPHLVALVRDGVPRRAARCRLQHQPNSTAASAACTAGQRCAPSPG